PYCGSGTTLVEGFVRGINVAGTDLNPLARLISEAKLSLPEQSELDDAISRFNKYCQAFQSGRFEGEVEVVGIRNLSFWFKPDVIAKLSYLKRFIDDIPSKQIQLFFQVAFSETVRESSNTRIDEFKLYRYDSARLEKFAPNVFAIMQFKLRRNRLGLQAFARRVQSLPKIPMAHIYDFNTVSDIPEQLISPESVDIVLTSPPYGDSRTTVAYGQFSRLSSAWLGFGDAISVDRNLMGGKVYRADVELPSKAICAALRQIALADGKREQEVRAFYADLYRSIQNVATVIRKDGYACYVVGNRRVKGVELPTDVAVRDFFERCGFQHVETFARAIPNKRMPLQNSPTNEAGKRNATMTREFVVVMQKMKVTWQTALK
ncbi:MAG: hypothetical protein NZ844_04060, partial [Chloroherpetonaceae bacterium]|nr:hypothetical protein [Chloroherpetonaceae bacterium]